MKKRIPAIVLPIIAVMLELLPWGVVLYFADAEGGLRRSTYSHFSLIPYGYANFAPFFTAMLSCVILLLALIYILKSGAGIKKAITVLSLVSCVLSFAPVLYGVRYLTPVGICVSSVLILNTVLSICMGGKQNEAV